jgi:hypothetical protein
MSSCGADTNALGLYTTLKAGISLETPSIDFNDPAFNLPDIVGNPLYTDIDPVTVTELTEKVVNGDGVFDCLMTSIKNHLKEEFDQGKITGTDYTKAYVELTGLCLSSAIQFLLNKDQSYHQAVLAQMQARASEIAVSTAAAGLEVTKADLVIKNNQSKITEAEYALTKLRLATEDAQYCKLKVDTAQIQYQIDNILPEQKELITEQKESERAKTLDTRKDGSTPISGIIGKQKELYTQQKLSYELEAQYKMAKIYLDGWVTNKTIDEGLATPPELSVASVDNVIRLARGNTGLV